ncbi:MAG TPA: Na+/H+ antiporter [Steroidobacteraceae bacterium]|nr:Na+/H+ antiporter [Steroidobacteraceae bacterium]
MIPTIQVLVLLLVVLAAVAVVAERLKIPPAILLVLTGVALALFPGLPTVRLAPDFVLLFVLPPVIYASAVAMSWREFCFNLRPISLLAVGCVLFTTLAIAAASHWLLGLSWQVGFVLGAIVSPPDAVAPLSIARRMGLPRRILVVLEGEGLANDATALILYRFAVAAVGGGVFSVSHATGAFAAIVVGEVFWGLAVGWLMLRVRRWVHDPRIEIVLSVLTPFLAYWPPQHFGGSGVLATVTTGLYISWNGLRLISAATRLQGVFFWGFLIYVIEGLVFLVTGLQARTLMGGIHSYSPSQLATSATVVITVVIVTRFVWMYPAIYLPRLVPAIARKDPSPPWQWAFVLAFTGVRGIISLAAALAIPLETAGGLPFPNRDLILFLTFVVVLVTLVGQGLTLPLVIRWLGLAHAGRRERAALRVEEFNARRQAIEVASDRLQRLAVERGLPEDIVRPLREQHKDRLTNVGHRSDGDEDHERRIGLSDEIERTLIAAERDHVNELYRRGELTDEGRRRIERELDLREAHLASVRQED